MLIGIRKEYDREGNLIKIVDEDKKFGKIKPKDIVELLEKEGWFNRETGENKITEKDILPTTGEFYRRENHKICTNRLCISGDFPIRSFILAC